MSSVDRTKAQWDAIAENHEFQDLVNRKNSFMWSLFFFAMVYYFALPIGAGYFKEIMAIKVIGSINVAYLFALSQFFVAWGIAYVYAQKCNKVFDPIQESIKKRMGGTL